MGQRALHAALLFLVACSRTDTSSSAIEDGRLGLTQAEVRILHDAAVAAARAEAYDVEKSNLTVTRDGEHYKGLFTRKAKNALGGELHVVMDRTGRILRVYPGL